MITTKQMSAPTDTDAELVAETLSGNRDAFARIVERYQSLVCALTYSARGNLQASEDLAQVTFITAWCELRKLKEPNKLKSWLCGIARNVTNNSFRQDKHIPTANAEVLDDAADISTDKTTPSDHAISKEEEAILWRSLGELPPVYREPLVLFYRQHQSVTEVADALDLSEDAVKQRLSRGRAMLTEKVTAFVEGALRQTAPGQEFLGSVLAALPLAASSVATAGAGAAAKGSTAAKVGSWAAWLAPFVGIMAGMTAHWLVVRAAPTDRERRAKKIAFTSLWVFVLVWCVVGQLTLHALRQRLGWSDRTYFSVMTGYWWVYTVVGATMTIVMLRQFLAIRREVEKTGESHLPSATPLKPATSAMVWAGTYLAFYSWLICVSWQFHDRITAGISTGLMLVLWLLSFFSLRGRTGVAAMQSIAWHLTFAWATVLVILNLRLDTWIATAHRSTLAEIHRLMPPWVIPSLTLALLLWAGLVMALTRPKAART